MDGTSRITIADVARRAGVSKGSVSFALNDRPGIAAETRERILGVAREMGWRPSLRGRSLSVGKSFACGLVIGRSVDVIAADPFFPSFIAGIQDEFSLAGQVLVLAVVPPGGDEESAYRDLADQKRVDGIVLTDLRVGDERIALATALGLAAVTLGEPDVVSPFSSVSVDDRIGIREAVRHVRGLGHTRIAHVAGPATMLHSVRRRDAFESAMREARLEPLVETTDFSAREGAQATEALLARPDRPTAIVYSNDHMAVAGLGVASRLGLVVPDDLSIVGFDDTDLGRHLHPALTSVATDSREWGAVAARTLLAAIAGDGPVHLELAEPRLAVRESTGPVPAEIRGTRRD
jgi:transcriptional regulator, LacI family